MALVADALAPGGVIAYATGIGDTVEVGGNDIWIASNQGDHYTQHFDGTSGEDVFCLEQNYLGGNGTARLVEIIGRKTRIFGRDGTRDRTVTWQQVHVTDVAGIVNYCYNVAGFTNGVDKYVTAQGLIWAYIYAGPSLEGIPTQATHYLPSKYSVYANPCVSYVQSWRQTHVGHGILYSKGNGDQELAKFSWEELTTQVTVRKVWAGAGAKNHLPASVVITLTGSGGYSGSATLRAPDWSHTFSNLPVNQTYTVSEPDVPDGFTVSIEGQGTTSMVVTNTYHLPRVDVPIEKRWSRDDDDEYRPSQVMVHLRGSNGVSYDLTLTESGGWQGSIDDVPLEDVSNGSAIDWSLVEDAVENYTSNVSGSVQDGFTVMNELQTGWRGVEKAPSHRSWLSRVEES